MAQRGAEVVVMILNWFSPLPPATTDIAHYTGRILPALRKRAEVILWTDQAEWDPRLETYAEVRRYQPEQMPWVELNHGDMSIYHIGNNRLFHGSLWQVSRHHPGVVVLHDLCLHNFFAGLYRDQWQDHDGYVMQMERHYGQVGRQDAEAFWGGQLTIENMMERYPLTLLAVENALGVLVHSEDGLDKLTRMLLGPVTYARLPYHASPRSLREPHAAASVCVAGPPYRIVIFGYIYINRRLDAVLEAIAGLPEREKFRLDIYGQIWDSDHVRARIEALGLQVLVTSHGFVPEVELDKAMAAAHLAINLRYPTMGEASGSQLRIWDHALPSLVTRRGWYAKLPHDSVAFVTPEHEVADIQTHLRAFLADPERFARMGERGRRILEEHHAPEVYAQAVVDLAAAAHGFRLHAAARELAKRVDAEMRVWGRGSGLQLTPNLWNGHEESRWRQNTIEEQTESIDLRQVALLQTVRQAAADQIERLRQEETATLEAIGQAVAAYHERLGQLPETILQSPPQDPYTREEALRFPVSVSSHDIGFRYLFDFTIMARSLDLRPGAEVLDFASGSGYVSELLNRLGYTTIAFDLDPELLAVGRERLRLDPRCDTARTHFVVGDGLCLPFPDESFDGIICMNALHHMPDYQATLAEMYRVLRPGGRAVFSEPGAEHSKTPESINMMKQFGVLERDIILSDIYELARRIGFRRLCLKPYVYPEQVEVDYEEFALLKEGKKVSTPYLSSQEIADTLERYHPLFYLEKDGERPLTSASASPELLQARIVIKECPERVSKGKVMRVIALCENTGQSLWLSKARPLGGFVSFGVKLLTPNGRLLDDTRGRQPLTEDVPPGGQIEVVSEVSLEGLESGCYRILFDMVNELVNWFQDKGSEAAERWVEIV
jgi:SAM-dependent methyltransferase/glycosyltransferase involved in cell wall biosynthesis